MDAGGMYNFSCHLECKLWTPLDHRHPELPKQQHTSSAPSGTYQEVITSNFHSVCTFFIFYQSLVAAPSQHVSYHFPCAAENTNSGPSEPSFPIPDS